MSNKEEPKGIGSVIVPIISLAILIYAVYTFVTI